MKTGLKTISALMYNIVSGVILALMLGVSPLAGAATAVCISGVAGNFMPSGCAFEGVFTEIWTGELVKKLRAGTEATWLDGIPDYSDKAENDVIHLIDVGGDPDVLINNTTYPIPVQELVDTDIPIGLDKYQTKATRVTDDELYASSYDKMASVKERHGEAILENKFKKAIHALAPQKNTAKTPVIMTTGANADGRRRLLIRDIIALKDRFDKMEVPTQGRRLVLCTDHVNDLLMQDQTFKEQYYNYTSGKISNMYGFEVYEYVSNPYFTTGGVKKDFKAAPASTDYQASVAFYVKRMFKASGTTKMYYSEAKNSPTTQESMVNFRHYFIVLPKKQEAIAAIASSAYTAEISATPEQVTFPANGGTRPVAVSASSDFAVMSIPEGFSVTRTKDVLLIVAGDNTAGTEARGGEITLLLSEDITKTAQITVSQPAGVTTNSLRAARAATAKAADAKAAEEKPANSTTEATDK